MGEVYRFLASLPRGHRVVYYTGFLMTDTRRWVQIGKEWGLWADNPPIKAIRDDAWRAYEEGIVLLTQRKVAPGVYDYIATRV